MKMQSKNQLKKYENSVQKQVEEILWKCNLKTSRKNIMKMEF